MTTADRRGEVTRIFQAIEAGDKQALGRLVEVVYDELRRIARSTPKGKNSSLNTTGLLHEAILRLGLLDSAELSKFSNRKVFFAAAAAAMRRILIDRARKRKAAKRGGDFKRESMDVLLDRALDDFEDAYETDFLDLHEALEELEKKYPRAYEVALLRFFCGLKEDEVKDYLKVSKATVQGDWRLARAWLSKRLGGTR